MGSSGHFGFALKSGVWYSTFGKADVVQPTINELRVAPFYIPSACLVNRLSMEVATAGASSNTARMCIYADDGTNYPGTLLCDSGAPTFVDGVANGTTTFTSATANFTTALDAGKTITGTNLSGGTTISSVTNTTTVVLSQVASGSGTGSFSIARGGISSTTTGYKTMSVNQYLPASLVWIGAVSQTGTAANYASCPTFQMPVATETPDSWINSNIAGYSTITSGAPPNTFSGGTVGTGSTTTSLVASSSVFQSNHVGSKILMTSGTYVGSYKIIDAYVSGTNVTFVSTFVAPTNGNTFQVIKTTSNTLRVWFRIA